jgi:cell division protein FtsB
MGIRSPDYHLHRACKLLFGSVECDFSPEPATVEEAPAEIVPTRAELDFLRHENLQLQSTIAAQQKRIDILSSARLTMRDSSENGVTAAPHPQLSARNEELRAENEKLRSEIADLKTDLAAVTRERDATRQAWETLKAEQNGTRPHQPPGESTEEPRARSAANGAGQSRGSPGDRQRPEKPLMSPEAHRAMAAVLVKAPTLLQSVRLALENATMMSANGRNGSNELLSQAAALTTCMEAIKGHPVERLATSFSKLLHETGATDMLIVRTLQQALELAKSLLNRTHLSRVKELSHPRVLAIDDDHDLLTTLISTLGAADMLASGIALPSDAFALLRDKKFRPHSARYRFAGRKRHRSLPKNSRVARLRKNAGRVCYRARYGG